MKVYWKHLISIWVVGDHEICNEKPSDEFIEQTCQRKNNDESEYEVKVDCGISPYDVLPNDQRFYTYEGSLTTPPCYESVQWVMYKCPIRVSRRVSFRAFFQTRRKIYFSQFLESLRRYRQLFGLFTTNSKSDWSCYFQAFKALQAVKDAEGHPIKEYGVRRPLQVYKYSINCLLLNSIFLRGMNLQWHRPSVF